MRRGWVVWEEDGRYPDVIVELMSPSTAEVDKGHKKNIYERTFKTADYFVFDPFDPDSLQGWHLDTSEGYKPLEPNEQGWLWCQTLGFWLGTWQGTIDRETAEWLRFYNPAENLVLLPEEAEKARADIEKARANAVQQQLEATQQKVTRSLLRLLQSRFGEVPIDIQQSLSVLDLNKLGDLLEVAATVDSLEEFTHHLST